MEGVLGQIDLLALILACLPMSKHKLSLQLVSKTWKMALETPAAHSLKTDDSELPFAGHGMSKRVTQVLSQCKSRAWGEEKDRKCDKWLGPSLQRLDLGIHEDSLPLHFFESLQVMPRLNQLHIFSMDLEELYQYDLSQKFPGLNMLFWGTKDGEAPSHLERLTELTSFEFYMSETSFEYDPHRARDEVGALPKDFKVILSILDEPSPLPAGLINQITSMDFLINAYVECWPEHAWEDGKPVMDFGSPVWPAFSQAISLTQFHLDCSHTIIVGNVGVLSKSCKVLEFRCIDLQLSLADIADNGFRFGEVVQGTFGQRLWKLIRD